MWIVPHDDLDAVRLTEHLDREGPAAAAAAPAFALSLSSPERVFSVGKSSRPTHIHLFAW